MKFQLYAFCLLFFGIHSDTFSQINWQPTNGPEGGRFLNIYEDGQYAYVTDEDHLFRTNNGLNWEQLPYGNIWPMATSPGKLAGGQGFGHNFPPSLDPKIVVSYDHGSTWIEGTMPPITNGYFSSIAVCSHGIYIPDSNSDIFFRTQDDGLTWDSISAPGLYCYDMWVFDDRLYVVWDARFWRLSLNGTDWEVVSPVFNNSDPVSMFAADSLLFFATKNTFWCSSNSGSTGIETPISYYNDKDKFCKIGDRIYKGVENTGILYTDDFGQHWQKLPISNNFYMFDLASAGGQLLCAINNRGVLRYDAPNQQLIPSNEGLNSAIVNNLDAGNGLLWAACSNGVFAYDLDQEIWVDKAPLPTEYFENITISPAGKIMASRGSGKRIYLSLNDGASWDTIIVIDPQIGSFSMDKIYWLGENILVESGSDDDAWSSDLGQTWEFGNFPTEIVFFTDRHFGINVAGKLVSSVDFGQSWQAGNGPNILRIKTLFATNDKLFALCVDATGRTEIYSTSNVSTWTYSSEGLPQINIDVPFSKPYKGGIWQKGDRYYLHQPSIGFFTSPDNGLTWMFLERTYGVVAAADATFFKGVFGGGVFKTGVPQNYEANSTGHVFKDDNNNGIWDTNEAALPNLAVSIQEPSARYPYWFDYTKSDGGYSIGSSPGAIDTLRVEVPSAYLENINPPYHLVTNSGNKRNFGVHFKADVTDVSITGYYAGRPRAGFPLSTYLVYRNEGTIPASGAISVKLDPKYQFISADPPPTTIIGSDSLIWDFNAIPFFSQQRIQIIGRVDSTTILGSLFKINGHIEPSQSDFNPLNNHFMRSDIMGGGYAPIEKRVEPSRGLTENEIAAGKELLYTVQFQNTGNSQANRVRITDMLDTALNVNTLRLVASSHEISTFRLLPGNLLEVIFDPIALPNRSSSEPESRGFVSFAIQRNKAYYDYYEIRNRAAVYFDFKEPIFTNTVITRLAQPPVSSSEPDAADPKNPSLMISPNPTAKDFVVDTRSRLKGPGDLVLINAQGKICFSTKASDLSNPMSLTVNNLSDGVYLVRVSGKQGVMFGKLVIAR